MSRILIVEDEVRIASFLEKGLRANGYATEVAVDGAHALRLVRIGDFDLVILDLGLPDMDGSEVLRRLRSNGMRAPVIILTARDDVRDTVAGLEGGADDYVTKPFKFEELLARLRVRLRGDRAAEPTVLLVGDAALDVRTRQVRVGDRVIDLSAREFALAEVFFRHPGQVLSREQAPQPGLGLRLRSGLERRRRLRRLPEAQAREEADQCRPRDGLPARAGRLNSPDKRTLTRVLDGSHCQRGRSSQQATREDEMGRHWLKGSIGGLVLLAAAVAAPPALAEERTCRGTLRAVTVDNLCIPQGATCKLRGTRIKGTVKVERGARLFARHIRVVGNVQGEGARHVAVTRGSRVGGSIQVVQGRHGTVRGTRIAGDVQFFENRGRIEVRRSRINGNLQCKENSRRPVGGRNVVGGNKEDQCARL
jgi:DNA-binding response OmpR family regulator